MNTSKLRGWLLQLPKPEVIKVTIDDEVEEVKLGKSWQKTAETIAALNPEKVQCFDKEGRVLRALSLDSADARRSDAAELPLVIAQDPHAAMLTHFANLLHRAYEHSTEIAFVKMVELTDRMNERSDSIEQRLERAEARARRIQDEQIDDAYAHAEEIAAAAAAGSDQHGELGNVLLEAFMSGRLQRQGDAAGAGKTNGKVKANGAGGAKGQA